MTWSQNITRAQWDSYWGILGFPFTPTVDGEFLPAAPRQLLRAGRVAPAQMMIGTNQDEGQSTIHNRNVLNQFLW